MRLWRTRQNDDRDRHASNGDLRIAQNGAGMFRVESYSYHLDQWMPITHKMVAHLDCEMDGENAKYVTSRQPWIPCIHYTREEAEKRVLEIMGASAVYHAMTTWTPVEDEELF